METEISITRLNCAILIPLFGALGIISYVREVKANSKF